MIFVTKNKKGSKGFTLIETFVAITILVIAVITPLSLLSKAIQDGNYAKNQITSYYLAQEALELVINKKLQNTANSVDWLHEMRPCVDSYCYIYWDVVTGQDDVDIEPCDPSDESCRLSINGQGLYVHNLSFPSSIFKRYFTLTDIIVDDGFGQEKEAKVNVYVSWNNKGTETRAFELSGHIFNFTF